MSTKISHCKKLEEYNVKHYQLYHYRLSVALNGPLISLYSESTGWLIVLF